MAASGALTDPWVRLRAGDYSNLALIVTQVVVILVAAASGTGAARQEATQLRATAVTSASTRAARQGPPSGRPVLDITRLLAPRQCSPSTPSSGGSSSMSPSPLYSSLATSHLMSVKFPLTGGGLSGSTFQAASSRVLAAARAALRHRNGSAAAAAAASQSAGGLGGAYGSPGVAASGLASPPPPRLVPLSCVCVEGCAHLLMLVHEPGACAGMEAAGADEQQLGPGQGLLLRHTVVDVPAEGWGEGGEAEVASAVDSAMSEMLRCSEAADGSGEGAGSDGCMVSCGQAAVWPPAVPLVNDDGVEAAAAAVSDGGMEDAADSGVVVVACGASLLRGLLEAVQCVVAGPGDCGGGGAAAEEEEQDHVFVDSVVPVVSEPVVPVVPAAAEQHEQQHQAAGKAEATGADGAAGQGVGYLR